jgi:hypothetical protein
MKLSFFWISKSLRADLDLKPLALANFEKASPFLYIALDDLVKLRYVL